MKTRLLVHATAPSARSDDKRYQAQALRYASVKGRRVANVSEIGTGPATTEASVVEESRPSRGQDDLHEGETRYLPFLEDTQLAISALESQLITPSLAAYLEEQEALDRSLDARPLAERIGLSPDSQSQIVGVDPSQDTDVHGLAVSGSHAQTRTSNVIEHVLAHSPVSSESDRPSQSSYLKSPVLTRLSKRQKLDDEFEKPERSRRSVQSVSKSVQGPVSYIRSLAGKDRTTTYGEGPAEVLGPASHPENQGDDQTSELPTSYSLSVVASGSDAVDRNALQGSFSPSLPLPLSTEADISRKLECTNQPAFENSNKITERQRNSQGSARNDTTTLNESKNQIAAQTEGRADLDKGEEVNVRRNRKGPSTTQTSQQNPHSQKRKDNTIESDDSARAELKDIALTIRPPQPEVTVDSFGTVVTQALRNLTENSDIQHSYRPESVARELRPLERGYWVLDCSIWPVRSQIEFWRFLEKTIVGGSAGWGVWAARNDCEEETASKGGADQNFAAPPTSLGIIKVFCWGQIAEHIYLLLYVASMSRVRKLGLQWRDATEQVVIQMRRA